jgi:transketolase
MPVFNTLNMRSWSKLGQRGALFGDGIFEIIQQYSNAVVVTADLGFLSGLERFMNQHPDHFYNTGIAEQNMMGVSAGLASEGKIPFTTTYATFVTMRSCEQMRHYMGYMRSNIKVIGSGAGLVMSFSGSTHYTMEDISIVRAIPNMVVISPADAAETLKAAFAAAAYDGPVYIRLTGALNQPMVYKDDYTFEIGKAVPLKHEGDICILANGSMVYNALQASELLQQNGVAARVINMHTIKPLDTAIIDSVCQTTKLFVTVEEHSVIGGLGGAVAEYLSSVGMQAPLLRLGIADRFAHAGEYQYLLGLNGLLPDQIAASVEEKYIAIAGS